MDEQSARHLFHEFHSQDDASKRGLGLGLVLARHLAHLMDGEITFRSKPGEGTRFDLNLPIERPETGEPQPRSP
jgi:signal transduction histidine kinase